MRLLRLLRLLRLDYCSSLYCGLPKREIDKQQRRFRTVPHAWFQE